MDIVERLRQLEVNELSTHPLGMLDEAANEIEQNRIDLEEYRLDVERLRAALKEIAKPTYGTEFNMSDEDRADILGRHLFAKQDLARTALSGDKHE